MTKSSKSAWKAAGENVSLPECPGDLSEPEYADLIYGKGCYNCNAPLAKNLYMPFRLRLCKNCYYADCGLGYQIASDYGEHVRKDKVVYRLAPYELADARFESDIEDDSWRLDYGEQRYDREVFSKVLHKYVRLKGQERTDYVKRRMEYTTKVMDVEQWFKDNDKRKENEKQAISDRRRESIFTKLKELGYNDEDFGLYDYGPDDHYTWHHLTEEPKELTDKIWKRIKPQLEEQIRTRRYFRANPS
ncbi:hypothetical protein DFH11DRAFT_1035226 [Phellopilus nigrolimitatus]|nr:hypothetical protein DFH11DRAFT_1035226 [Phellopilus nigrolimitatus]